MNLDYRIKEHIIFDDTILVYSVIPLLRFFKAKDFKDLALKINKYIEDNKEKLEKVNLANKYCYQVINDSEMLLETLKLEPVNDIDELIVVFAKTSGPFFIPNKELEVDEENFKNFHLYKAKEIHEGRY